MQILERRGEDYIEFDVEGRLDANSSSILEAEINKNISSMTIVSIVLDFSKVEYISSATIRVLLSAQKKIDDRHELIIKKPSEFCKQVFNVTGADIFLKIIEE